MLRVAVGREDDDTPSQCESSLARCLTVLREAGAYPAYLERAVQERSEALASLMEMRTCVDYCATLDLDALEALLTTLGWDASTDDTYRRSRSDSSARVFTRADRTEPVVTIVCSNGTYYRGPVTTDDRLQGEGDMYGFCGQLAYRGGWRDGLFHGDGVEYHANHSDFAEYHTIHKVVWYELSREYGSHTEHVMNAWTCNDPWYTGAFKDGKYDGQGRLSRSYQNTGEKRETMTGTFKNGRLHGNGEHIDGWHNIQYTGEFKEGKLDGQGSITYRNTGARYEGGFRCGARHGLVTIYDQNGDVSYKGQFTDGSMDGPGTYHYEDGSRFEGVFHMNNLLRAGHNFFFADGTRFAGTCMNFQPVNGTHEYLNGDRYDGEFYSCVRSGKGTCFYANGDVYEGQWKYDKPDGDGLWWFAKDEGTYTGHWCNGAFDGVGVYAWPDGCAYEASWRDGMPTAAGVFAPQRCCVVHALICKRKQFSQPPDLTD